MTWHDLHILALVKNAHMRRCQSIAEEADISGPSHLYIGSEVAHQKHILQKVVGNEAEELLWKYGVDATWKDCPDKDRANSLLSAGRIIEIPQKYRLGDTTYDLYNLEQNAEWKAVGGFRSANDIIVLVPGKIGWNGVIWKNGAAHSRAYHVIALAGPSRVDAETVAHEVLHHLLEDTINPGSSHPSHDVHSPRGGIMRGDVWTGTRKLGCKTVEALKRKGVLDSEIDASLIIR